MSGGAEDPSGGRLGGGGGAFARGRGDGPDAPAADALRAALRARSGFADEAVAPARLRALLAARATELRLSGEEEAARLALRDAAEYARLESHFAPPETWLFRYPESFEFVRALAGTRGARPLRALILGAGGWCEPCAMAAALLEGGRGSPSGARPAVVVEASDRSAAVFAPAPVFAGVHLRAGVPAWAERHFTARGDALEPGAAVSGCIRTRVEDAAAASSRLVAEGARFDIVSFRNVAIYLHAEARRAVFANLAALLEDDGALLVGHAESSAAAAVGGLVPDPAPGAFALRRTAKPAPAPRGGAEPAPAPTPRARPNEPLRGAEGGPRRGDADPRRAELDALRAQLSAHPADAPLHVRLAAALLAQREVLAASESVARALYLDPLDEDALMLAARIADERGATADADRYRQRALRAHLARMQRDGGA